VPSGPGKVAVDGAGASESDLSASDRARQPAGGRDHAARV